ncbi:hypothetical protein NC651_022923, partial [Populus alba x Populus x berolinensis]
QRLVLKKDPKHIQNPLYNGGIFKDQAPRTQIRISDFADGFHTPALKLHNPTQGINYFFSIWVKIHGADSTLNGCWSFLNGGFTFKTLFSVFVLVTQGTPDKSINITIASASLQSFTEQQWRTNQQDITSTANSHGDRLQGAYITIDQISKDFPFGSAIASTILGNLPYQNWFV